MCVATDPISVQAGQGGSEGVSWSGTVVAGSVSPKVLADLNSRVAATGAILDGGNPAQIAGLTREQVLGDQFEGGMLGYYAQYLGFAYTSGLQLGGFHYLAGGVGTFGYEPHVDYTFGVPKDVNSGALLMNVPIINVFGADGTDSRARTIFALEMGTLSSALEAAVPEQLIGVSQGSGNAISAVTALNIASAAGQKIYHITQANEATVLPLVNHSSQVMQEISDALSSGKEVITHSSDISASGWTGAGYIIFDPGSGDGAYKISGGQNGDWLYYLGAMAILVMALAGGLAGPIGLLLTGYLAIRAMKNLVARWDNYTSQTGVLTAQTRLNAEVFVGELSIEAMMSVIVGNRAATTSSDFESGSLFYWSGVLAMYYWVVGKITP